VLFVTGKPPSETQTLRSVEQLVTDRLPRGWTIRTSRQLVRGRRRSDAIWALRAPGGDKVELVVEVKKAVLARDLTNMLEQIRGNDKALPFIAAPYLSPRSREVLTELGVSFGDSTGNLRLVSDRPAIFVETQGATKDPWPSDEALQSLRGRGAGRAVRAIVDFRAPFGVRDLSQRAGVSLGTLSRVIDLLDRDGLVTRSTSASVSGSSSGSRSASVSGSSSGSRSASSARTGSGIADVDWAGVIRRWSRDYDVRESNEIATHLDPRGLGALATKLSATKWLYAATGAFAAQRFAPIAPSRTATIYVEDIARAAQRLKLQPADSGANVILAEPYDPVVFDRTVTRDELRIVAPSQLAVDLLTGPGREPSEGEELLEWMRRKENDWRA